jgi:hypothetical protein
MTASPIPATGVGWNTGIPDDGQPHGNDYNEHRETKLAVSLRLAKEHVAFDVDGAGAEHKLGSAVAYSGDYSTSAAGDSLPTTKPDGTTALDADDEGRLAYDTDTTYGGILYRWDGTNLEWVALTLKINNIDQSVRLSFIGDYSSASAGDDLPENKPGTSTPLDADDNGRVAYDTDVTYGDVFYQWVTDEWVAVDDQSDLTVPTTGAIKGYTDAKYTFGAWTDEDSATDTLIKDTIYKADCDGFIVVNYTSTSVDTEILGYTDSSATPTTVRFRLSTTSISGNKGVSFTMPVKKDDYAKVTSSGATAPTIFWLPIGTGGLVAQ